MVRGSSTKLSVMISFDFRFAKAERKMFRSALLSIEKCAGEARLCSLPRKPFPKLSTLRSLPAMLDEVSLVGSSIPVLERWQRNARSARASLCTFMVGVGL